MSRPHSSTLSVFGSKISGATLVKHSNSTLLERSRREGGGSAMNLPLQPRQGGLLGADSEYFYLIMSEEVLR